MKPLVELPEVPETLNAQVEKQIERLQSKEDNSVDLLQARRRILFFIYYLTFKSPL